MLDKVHFCLSKDGTPVIGGIFDSEEDAVRAVRNYISLAKEKQNLLKEESDEDISLEFIRQKDRRFKLIVNLGRTIGCIEELANVDELMLKKFKKGLEKKTYFILTSFFKDEENKIESLIYSKSLGLMIYKM